MDTNLMRTESSDKIESKTIEEWLFSHSNCLEMFFKMFFEFLSKLSSFDCFIGLSLTVRFSIGASKSFA